MAGKQPLIIERHPYRVEIVQLGEYFYFEIIRLDTPDRLMAALEGPFDTEREAIQGAEGRLNDLVPREVAFGLTQCSYNLSELLGLADALDRDRRHGAAQGVRITAELMAERIEGAV